jgi:hypothetical protein
MGLLIGLAEEDYSRTSEAYWEEIAMPLTRLKDEYLEQDGVRFLMEDEAGSTVACSVSHETLRDHADRMHFSGTDGAVFDAYRSPPRRSRG